MFEVPQSVEACVTLAETFLQNELALPVDLTTRLLEAGIDVSSLKAPEPELVPDWLAVLSTN